MATFYVIFEWLLVIALIGLIGVIVWLIATVLNLKNAAMRDAKRIYERPTNSVKTLIGTGKGIGLRESARFKHMAVPVKEAAGAVRVTVGEVKTAASGIHPSELKSVLSNVQSVLKLAGMVAKTARAAGAHQGEAS